MFTLKMRDKFSAARKLVGYPGNCANLHGHTWKVEVAISGYCLNDLEMLVDFQIAKSILGEVIDLLDHSNLNEVLEYDLPTAEYLSWYIYSFMKTELVLPKGIELKEVTVWESNNACVTYDEVEYE